jgi:hypothetical protein
MIKLLLTLRFYATGSLLLTMGDYMGVSKPSACRFIKKESESIVFFRPRYIEIYENVQEMENGVVVLYFG